MRRIGENERALNVRPAVAPARKLEVTLAYGANLLEEFENVVAFHGVLNLGSRPRAGHSAGRVSLKVDAESVNPKAVCKQGRGMKTARRPDLPLDGLMQADAAKDEGVRVHLLVTHVLQQQGKIFDRKKTLD